MVQGQVPGQPWNVCYLEYSSRLDVQSFCRQVPECEVNIMNPLNPDFLECSLQCEVDSDCGEGMSCFNGLSCNNPTIIAAEDEEFLKERLGNDADTDNPWE